MPVLGVLSTKLIFFFIFKLWQEINSPHSSADFEKYSELIRNIQLGALPATPQTVSPKNPRMIATSTTNARSNKLADIPEFTGKIVRILPKPIDHGAYCDIWKGELYGRQVAIHTNVLRTKRTALLVSLLWLGFDSAYLTISLFVG